MKQLGDLDEAPLYVRWEPDQLDFAIEIRLDIIGRMQQHVAAAQANGVEIGGIFLGRSPQENSRVLRIEDLLPIERRAEDGPIFMLDPQEHDRFLTTKWDARSHSLAAVGFFRTHVRPGPLRLSLADRTLVTGHFTKSAMAVIIAQAKSPFRAALFAGTPTRLPTEPSIPEFVLNRSEFEALPEASLGGGATVRSGPLVKTIFFWALCVVLFAGVAGVVYRTWDTVALALPGSHGQGPSLRITGDRVVTVAWNHLASSVIGASTAKLSIVDGSQKTDLAVGGDTLRLGKIEYAAHSPQVDVTLTLNMPDASQVIQSATWRGQPMENFFKPAPAAVTTRPSQSSSMPRRVPRSSGLQDGAEPVEPSQNLTSKQSADVPALQPAASSPAAEAGSSDSSSR